MRNFKHYNNTPPTWNQHAHIFHIYFTKESIYKVINVVFFSGSHQNNVCFAFRANFILN